MFDPLWGELAPVPEENVRVADGDVLGWDAFPTPGHASHHVWYLRDGTLLAGDAAGVRMPGASYVLPVSPPPDITSRAGTRRSPRSAGASPSGSRSSTSASTRTSTRTSTGSSSSSTAGRSASAAG